MESQSLGRLCVCVVAHPLNHRSITGQNSTTKILSRDSVKVHNKFIYCELSMNGLVGVCSSSVLDNCDTVVYRQCSDKQRRIESCIVSCHS